MLKHRILTIVFSFLSLAAFAGTANAAIPSWELEEEQIETSGLPDPLVQYMLDQVTTAQLMQYNRELAGEIPVWVDGDWYTITSRHTYSGESMHKTTSYIGQHLQELGLDVEYHVWENEANPNVIGEIPGLFEPQDIFIIGGHLDAVPSYPGADDNASGSVATLIAADILSQFNWGCTLRFAFWTGEEEGLLGSTVYAERAYQNGENILGYLNLDMIGWNTLASSPDIDLIYNALMPSTQALAQLFSDVVYGYELDLVPELIDDPWGGSDHLPFWDYGFSSILAIEDLIDFNPYYHEAGDTPDHLDQTYFTNFSKASLATFVHLSGCLIPRGLGEVSGHVSSAPTGEPIEAADLSFKGSLGSTFDFQTGSQGFYSGTLLVDTYTVTASTYGYLTQVVTAVEVLTGTLRVLDFSLQVAPTFTVSGTVSEITTGAPLLAQVIVNDSPVSTWTDPLTGLYEIVLPQGAYTFTILADYYHYQDLRLTVDKPLTQDFSLQLLGCILLVDDDEDAPDVSGSYTASLELLGVSYDLWDTEMDGNLTPQALSGYPSVFWFTGASRSTTLYFSDELALSSYLDAGGNLFLSSQDYLYDKDLNAFGTTYFHLDDYVSDVGQLDLIGQNVFSGLGPYHLFFPYPDLSDMLIPVDSEQIAFTGNATNPAITYAGAGFKTVFFGFPLEAIDDPEDGIADRAAILSRALEFFGGCEHPEIVVDPLSMDLRLERGQTGLGSFFIRNSGSGYLTFTITDTQSVSWLAISLSAGGVLPTSSQPVTLTFDASLLPVGTYTTTLEIHSADLEQPVMNFSVSLTVVPPIYLSNLPLLNKR
jgi:hypothetical protein